MTSASVLADRAPEVAQDPYSVRIYLPDERLRSYATFYYVVETSAPLHDFLYPEWGNARFSVSGSWIMRLGDNYPDEPLVTPLFGPTDRAAEVISSGGKTAGFGLTPLGWERLLPMAAGELSNGISDSGIYFGRPAEDIRRELAMHENDAQSVALFDALLLAKLADAPPNSETALTIDRVLRERSSDVAAFADAAGLSGRSLHRACLRIFGFPPKRLLRRQRFLDTLGTIRVTEKLRFTSIIDPEYFDQAHFNRDFRQFMGLSPSAFLTAPRPLMGVAAQVQAAAGITLSFKLPPPPEG